MHCTSDWRFTKCWHLSFLRTTEGAHTAFILGKPGFFSLNQRTTFHLKIKMPGRRYGPPLGYWSGTAAPASTQAHFLPPWHKNLPGALKRTPRPPIAPAIMPRSSSPTRLVWVSFLCFFFYLDNLCHTLFLTFLFFSFSLFCKF